MFRNIDRRMSLNATGPARFVSTSFRLPCLCRFCYIFFTGMGNSAQVLGFSRDYLSSLGVPPPTVRTQPKQSSDYCQTQEVPLVQQL